VAAAVPVSSVDDLVDRFRALAEKAPEDAVLASVRILGAAVAGREEAAFVARAANALVRLSDVSSKRSLRDAAGAQSDLLVLVRALEEPETMRLLLGDDPLAEARIRGLLARLWLLEEEGGVCSARQLGQVLGGLSRQGVDKRRAQGRLLALEVGKRGYVYPLWQVQRGQVLPGLERVLAELDDFDPWMQAAFFLNPNTWLGGEAPLSALRRGDIERVVAAAATYAA
jgi:hypothetical protein